MKTRVLGSLVALLLLTTACEPPSKTEGKKPLTEKEEQREEPMIESAPWFTPPEDWAEQHPTLSPNARLEAHFLALAEAEAVAHAGDGGGRAWLERVDPIGGLGRDPGPGWRPGDPTRARPALPAASRHRFEVLYEAGEHGVAVGGALFLVPEIFWEWSRAQTQDPRAPGYVTAEVVSGDARLMPDASGTGFLVEGAPLSPGDRVRFVYGAGPVGAQVDRYAERGAEILLAVDADGDGFRGFIQDTPRMDILPHAARRLVAHGPADVAPDAEIRIRLALVDGQGNRTPFVRAGESDLEGSSLVLSSLPSSSLALGDPATLPITRWDQGAAVVTLPPIGAEGVLRLRMEGRGPLAGFVVDLPPIVVRSAARRLVWADLHGHTSLSDGTGRPIDYFRYARDVAGLDVAALTDHDHWGPRPLDEDPAAQSAVFTTTEEEARPGRFVTVPGYEWTSWLHGHRHVLWFDPVGSGASREIHSAIRPGSDRPDELWAALRGSDALTFAHHSAGDPVATNWAFAPDPVLEPVTEIASVHGQSESEEMPSPVQGALPGWFVKDVLGAGYRLGFIGSGDSHDGHPGLTEIAGGQGGLAGLFVDRLDRAGVRDALRRRGSFATNGIRPYLRVSIDEVAMGGTLPLIESTGTHRLRIRYEATAPIEAIELVRSGRVARLEIEASLSVDVEREIPALREGEFHYVRVRQRDGGSAWSSPVFVSGDD